jgi:hypothetical protein
MSCPTHGEAQLSLSACYCQQVTVTATISL